MKSAIAEFGALHLVAQRRRPLLEEIRGAGSGRQLVVDLTLDVDLGQPIGDLRGLVGIFRRERDAQDVGEPVIEDADATLEDIGRELLHERRGLALERLDRRRFLRSETDGLEPGLRQQGQGPIERLLDEAIGERGLMRQQGRIELGVLIEMQIVHHADDVRA